MEGPGRTASRLTSNDDDETNNAAADGRGQSSSLHSDPRNTAQQHPQHEQDDDASDFDEDDSELYSTSSYTSSDEEAYDQQQQKPPGRAPPVAAVRAPPPSAAAAPPAHHRANHNNSGGLKRKQQPAVALPHPAQAEKPLENDDAPATPRFVSTAETREQREVEEFNFYGFEAELASEKNKRLLLARLQDTLTRGRLSLINLSRRNLCPDDAVLLAQAIASNPLLSVLKLGYNSLGDQGAAIIGAGISHNGGAHHQHLSVLDLGFNDIGDAGCEALALKGIVGNYTLSALYLSGNRIRQKGALAVAGAILHGTGISKLYLSGNRFGSMGMKAIAGAIAKNDIRISESAALAAAAMSVVTPPNPTPRRMEELHLSDTDIDSEGFISIPGLLLTNSSLTTICVCNNSIADRDMMLLSQALSQNKGVPIAVLRLSFNQITCQGVECLMNAVWGSSTLRELKLDNNRIQDRGAQLCAVSLTSIALEILDLSFNRITTIGVKALMKNISENNSLKSLSLCGVPIDQNASKAVSYAVAYNSSLRSLNIDNCSTGYSSQRHIVAGVVSNRRANLRTLTGFHIGPIAMTLGMPNLPPTWSNDQVLGFFRLMWQQWLLKSGRGTAPTAADGIRGPAPPAAVAAAAKIALSALGGAADDFFHTEAHERPISESSPIEPGDAALLERTDSGTMQIPTFGEALMGDIDDWAAKMSKSHRSLGPTVPAVRGPLENPERRNRNLQWLRVHFRSLNEVGRLPFNNADLWQLHQYYFSPPFAQRTEADESAPETRQKPAPLPPTEIAVRSAQNGLAKPRQTGSPSMDRAVSFQALGDALAAQGLVGQGNKRRSDSTDSGDAGHITKRVKSLSKPRIAWYPRIMNKVQSLGAKPMDKSLSLLRQLKYTENVMFEGRDPYDDETPPKEQEAGHSDVEMVLLDLL